MKHRSLAIALGSTIVLAACASVLNTESDSSLGRRSDMVLQNALDDDALRSLLSDVYAAVPRDPNLDIYIGPQGEVFDARGVYFKVESRINREGVFEIADGMVCVEGPSIDRRCRYVIPYADGIYTLVDSSDGSQEILAVTAR